MTHQPIELLAAGLFAAAVLHTFSAKLFERLGPGRMIYAAKV